MHLLTSLKLLISGLDSQEESSQNDTDIGLNIEAIEVPCPDGLSYHPYQRLGIAYAAQRAACILADESGLGNTTQAIGVINYCPDIKYILILCEEDEREDWKRQLRKWLVRYVDVSVVTYDEVVELKDVLHLIDWDLLICDEAYRLKNYKKPLSQIVLGKRIYRGVDKSPIPAKRHLFLLDEHFLDRPIDLYPLLTIADPAGLGRNVIPYARRYCGTERAAFEFTYEGASNLDELRGKLLSTCLVHRLREEL
jgi:hypothetical protein